jgi:uncharacterized protein YkwD
MAWYRSAIRSTLCVLALCCSLVVSAAVAASRSGTGAPHVRVRAHSRVHGGQSRCGAAHRRTARKRIRSRGHRHGAKRSSFRTGARPRHHGGSARCPRRHSRKHHGSTHRHVRAGQRRAAASSICAETDLTPSDANLARVRAATLCLVNRERSLHGEVPLGNDARLEQAAQAHTEDMAFGDYFEHIGRGGDTPFSRIRGSGYIYSSSVGYAVGENIGWGTLWLGTPQAIVAAWMNSPAHRAIMLDGRYRDTAIGVSPHPPGSLAGGQRGAVYTQDFGVIITG